MSLVNRNFQELFILAVIKAAKQLPPAWDPKPKGRKGYDPRRVTCCCLLKIGFNQTYERIEALLKDSNTLKQLGKLPGHSVIHRGMQKLSIRYIRKL
jgi:hypothetical protein